MICGSFYGYKLKHPQPSREKRIILNLILGSIFKEIYTAWPEDNRENGLVWKSQEAKTVAHRGFCSIHCALTCCVTKSTRSLSFLAGSMRKKCWQEETLKNKSMNLRQIKWSIFTAKLKSAWFLATALLLQRCSVFFRVLATVSLTGVVSGIL